MSLPFVDIPTVAAFHDYYDRGKPKHPLITLVDMPSADRKQAAGTVSYRLGLYSIVCKRFEGVLRYGRSAYDFQEGTLMFTAPGQVLTPEPGIRTLEGWGLFFHPDLLNRSELGKRIREYSFFHYDVNEALHISEEERLTLLDSLRKIEKEYSQNIDKHTAGLIIDNLQLVLSYCDRFYDRQFLTRAKVHNDIVQRFERLLVESFGGDAEGIPDVKYFAGLLHLSPNYLSDLLHKYTGKTTQEHIHLQLIDKAKSLLWGTEKPVSEIAYELGFDYPTHFAKLFRAKTGMSPSAFRGTN
jgi:AraC family transcriptional activator of pobA